MVKLINPLFSNSAHGKMGGIVYQGGPNGATARTHVLQRYRPSAAQIQQNYFFGIAADNWRVLTQEQKDVYINKAKGTYMSGYNLFIQETIQHP